MPADYAIRVEGLRELNRAFARADKTVRRDKTKALRRAAEPVRVDAEALAVSRISRIGLPWSRMRVGVTTNVVYVAPKERGSRGRGPRSRPNLAGRLANDAMVPALQRNREHVVGELEEVLADMERTWAR